MDVLGLDWSPRFNAGYEIAINEKGLEQTVMLSYALTIAMPFINWSMSYK